MGFIKKHAVKISISIMIFILTVLSTYSIISYKGSNTSENNRIGTQFNGQMPAGGGPNNSDSNQPSNMQGQNSPNQQAPNFNQGSDNFSAPQNKDGQRKDNERPNGFGMQQGSSPSSSTKYSPIFIAYSIIFFIIFIVVFLLIRYKKTKISNESKGIIIAGLIIIGLLLRIYSGLLIDGHPFDIKIYQNWAASAANNLLKVYDGNSSVDYPPVYLYVLFVVGKIASVSTLSTYYPLLLKLPSIAADVLSAYFIYKVGKKHLSIENSLLLAAFYAFNPAVLINSTIWGQADSLFALFIILAMYYVSEDKLAKAAIFFAISVLMKPQGIIFLPLLLFVLIKKKSLKSFIQSAAAGILTAIIILLPFSVSKGFTWIFNLYIKEVGEYPYASNNAFNFYTLIGANHVKDSQTLFIFSYHTWGMLFIVLVTLLSGIIYIKSKDKSAIFIAALVQTVGVFNFSVGMHERYMFAAPILAVLAYVYSKDKRILALSVIFSIIVYLNTHIVLFEQFKGNNYMTNTFMVISLSLLNVLSFIYLIKIAVDKCIKNKILNNVT